jgi:hypothetical protein
MSDSRGGLPLVSCVTHYSFVRSLAREVTAPRNLHFVSCAPVETPDTAYQVIRENPPSRGTETSAEVLVGPPWRMVSNAGPQQWY